MTDLAISGAGELGLLQSAKVLVLGDVMLDRYVQGEVRRISPEAPVPVLLQHGTRVALGGAANVAANITAVGASATLVGRVGIDHEGEEIAVMLDALHLGHTLIEIEGVPTISKTRVVAGTQQLARIDYETAHVTTPDEEIVVLGAVRAFIEEHGCRAIVLADYAKGFLTADLVRDVIALALGAGIPVVTDPKGLDLSRYEGSTVLKPNLSEARAACSPAAEDSSAAAEDEIAYLTMACLRASGARNVVLSCSADGVAFLGGDAPELVQLPTIAREVADVSGAGDTLVGLMALGLAAGLPLRRAVEIGNIAAGAVCGKPGTATLSPTELLELVGRQTGSMLMATNPKVLTGSLEAGRIGAQYQQEGRRLVFANGCFDLLHAGHIRLLQHARSLGDALMVALNTDASIRRLKGAGRPLQSEADRCEIMAALECVDFVVLFEDDTPLDLVLTVRPMVLVKGDDYRSEDVVGGTEVLGWGGEVVLVPQLDGRSTSRLIGAEHYS